MTVTEAAARLDINYDFCLRLLRQGRLKGRKVRREWVVDAESVRRRVAHVASYRARIRANQTSRGG